MSVFLRAGGLALACLIAVPAAAQTQADMNETAGRDYRAADAAMTAQWRQTYAYMQGLDRRVRSRGGGFGYAASTLESQRAWLRFRDTQCVIEGGEFAGGTAQRMAQSQCLSRLSRERARQLGLLRWQR